MAPPPDIVIPTTTQSVVEEHETALSWSTFAGTTFGTQLLPPFDVTRRAGPKVLDRPTATQSLFEAHDMPIATTSGGV